jgi:adenine-specific DNA-methyltransferase
MPTLQFKGKNIIWNHHLSVPYHTLEEVQDLHFQPEKGNGNLIIEGDNLIALKALLPEYAGKVKCIYIDPPYNTGNEGWVYNDKVNSPLINNWLGDTVGTDDLTRHDKWLCMMTPRLKMLRDLLSDDGVIFISIDYRETHYLKALLDELFGRDKFVSEFIWHKKYGGGGDNKNIVTEHETVFCYTKTKDPLLEQVLNGIEYDFNDFAGYEIDDEGRYYSANESILMRGPNSTPDKRPNLCYPIIDPDGNEILPRYGLGTWAYELKTLDEKLKNNDLIWKQVKGLWMLYKKQYLFLEEDEVREKKPRTILDKRYSIGQTGEGTNRLKTIFNNQRNFPNPKPISLIKFLINLSTNTNDNHIILDSFAGSGTTFDAISDLNYEDGGNRKCILVQMKEDSEAEPDKNICQQITRERNKLAIEKFGYESGFKYLKLGTAIDPEKMLEGQLPTYEQFAKYIYYLGTGEHLAEAQNINAENHFVGTHGAKSFFLIYEQDVETLTRLALNLSIAEDIVKHSPNKRRVIYAPACFLDSDYMEEKQIEFVSIPYNLFERQTN